MRVKQGAVRQMWKIIIKRIGDMEGAGYLVDHHVGEQPLLGCCPPLGRRWGWGGGQADGLYVLLGGKREERRHAHVHGVLVSSPSHQVLSPPCCVLLLLFLVVFVVVVVVWRLSRNAYPFGVQVPKGI